MTPPLQSRFISTQVPCYLNWDYNPPILCNKFLSLRLRWGISLFLKRVFIRFRLPETLSRFKCPFQQPPPLILAKRLEEAKWGEEQRREYVRESLPSRNALEVMFTY
uniref:Uncharacterized protein n=1 Tax=Quercus lobata TaxID=97700 RepID=A0A7N2R6L8_QUELO